MGVSGMWIWFGGGVEKNQYLYFRKTFDLRDFSEARLKITADSRYVLYVNGRFIGVGPARGWPFEYFYDVYDVTPYLVRGRNVVAVLAQYYGISTFKYVRDNAGIYVRLEVRDGNGDIHIVESDGSWRVRPADPYVRNVPRISCQQEWIEVYDARREIDGWNKSMFDDGDWSNAVIVESSKKIVCRDIPFLTRIPRPPVRILRIRSVKPPKYTWYIDLRNNLLPGKYDANPDKINGIIATVIYSEKSQVARLRFIHPKWVCPQGPIRLNGNDVEKKDGYFILNLNKGGNLLLINVTGRYHDWGTSLLIDSEYKLVFKAPLGLEGPWSTFGPFSNNEEFKRVWNTRNEEDLPKEYVKPLRWIDYTDHDIFALTVFQKKVDKDVRIDNDKALLSLNEDFTTIYPNGSDIEILFDFGEEIYGNIYFELIAEEGTILDWNFFETLEENEPKYMFGLNNVMRYICKNGYQRYEGIVGRGFRYATLTIRNLKKPLKIRKISCILTLYPVSNRGSFTCSDELLNRIWKMCSHTLKLCMLDTFVDCPTYEQTLWVGDARVEALVNYYAFGELDIVKRSLRLAAKSLYRSPLPESQVPSGWKNILSTWSLLWVLAIEEYISYSRDIDFLKEIYRYVVETLHNLEKYMGEDGLLRIKAWNMLDWAPMDTPSDGVVTHLNILSVEAFRRGAKLSKILGDSENEKLFLRNADKIRLAVISRLWNSSRNGFIDSIHSDGERSNVISMATNSLAIIYNCVNKEQYSILREKLLNPPEDWVKPGSPYGMFFVLEAFEKLGYYNKIVEEIKDKWINMLYNGPGTCWETFNGTRSYCHGWSSGPLYFLSKIFLGVNVLKDVLIVEPKLFSLEKVEGNIPTPRGTIHIGWIKNNDCLKFNVEIPFRENVKIILPSYKEIKVVEGKCNYKIEEKMIVEFKGPSKIRLILC
ncbi:MAG TPA: hypothetical protein ENG40_02640, partial [Thermoprotei archaeon]|nr:hypothetical protein [Thermoprotei archaeon]